jgi:hypothetical protein
MHRYFRWTIAILLISGIAFLATHRIAWADNQARQAGQSALAKLSGFVWNDRDRDGLQDVGEAGIANVKVNLYDQAKKLVNTVFTDAKGHYQFDGLAPADYFVDFVPPTGFVFSPENQGQDDALDSDADPITGETVPVQLVAGDNTLKWDVGLYRSAPVAPDKPGTVKPPPAEVTICEDGIDSVGGVSTLEVNSLAPGYCLAAFLRNHGFALGRIPDGAGKVLANITFLRVFYHGALVYELPTADGNVQICYAVPAGKQAQIYFFDFYGPRFGQNHGQPEWQPLETTVDNGVACATAQKSGAYALIGQ